jgi:uncharacterized protein YdeI (YjbR/CyaY-like superfamily)
MKDAEEYCPKNKMNWRKWLELNHDRKKGVWLVFYKMKSPKYNLSWSDAVDQALCFGWIDSKKLTIDEHSYRQYYTKRKPNSTWSKINKDKVEKLMNNGLMEKSGLESIETAKKNGSWTILDEVEALVIPEDLQNGFDDYKGSMEYFDSLSKSVKKGLLYWVISAKRTETRQKRIIEIVENASKNSKPKQFR